MSHRFLRAWHAVQAILPGWRRCLFFVMPGRPWGLSAESMGNEIFWNLKYTRGTSA